METQVAPHGSKRNFIVQQGFDEPSANTCEARYGALTFQPWVVGALVVIGIIAQSAELFLALGVVLWWNALVPSLNPFDAIYNLTFGARRGAVRLTPAPVPRRFAQGMAGTFGLLVGVSLLMGWQTAAYTFQGIFLFGATAIAVGRFCLGSFVFHLIRGRGGFAMRTTPWARGR